MSEQNLPDTPSLTPSANGVVISSYEMPNRDWDEVLKAADILRMPPEHFIKISPYFWAKRVIMLEEEAQKKIDNAMKPFLSRG